LHLLVYLLEYRYNVTLYFNIVCTVRSVEINI
jgi:hypothetical protein